MRKLDWVVLFCIVAGLLAAGLVFGILALPKYLFRVVRKPEIKTGVRSVAN